ncbi:GNAT family N-acetyltransferase [Clostridium sp. UBA6640]|uniref:GNAT family N-acetyltransferase n=1 Tax=Clostridium sp. UBA6640 TaxID=1946370 RepID=UPI0025BA13D7|nr:GNAT family N-acetyltransferase [Clostridium sp. UBA6640]
MVIRKIQKEDNRRIEEVIRTCLIEFGGNREGLAWADPELSYLSEVYKDDNCEYWVVEDNGEIIGGCGIAPMKNLEGICELQKMYLLKEGRGTGVANNLMKIALEFASKYYDKCYLETLTNMGAANKFYKKHGFKSLDKPIVETEHFSCDAWYIKDLK